MQLYTYARTARENKKESIDGAGICHLPERSAGMTSSHSVCRAKALEHITAKSPEHGAD